MKHALVHSQLLADSLLQANLLGGRLDAFRAFDRDHFDALTVQEPFNFSQKLGHLYEDVLRALIEHSKYVDLLDSNVQIYKSGEGGARETLGELDYVLDVDGRFVHLELAVKFYLAVENEEGLQWVGPDARDSWMKKRLRMLSHQFRLPQSVQARVLLESRWGIDILNTHHLIYGCLFDRIGGTKAPAGNVQEDCHRGFWLKRDEWGKHFSKTDDLWFMPKHLWPVEPNDVMISTIEKVDKDKLFELSRERCVMFTDGKDRYFLVSDMWCETTNL